MHDTDSLSLPGTTVTGTVLGGSSSALAVYLPLGSIGSVLRTTVDANQLYQITSQHGARVIAQRLAGSRMVATGEQMQVFQQVLQVRLPDYRHQSIYRWDGTPLSMTEATSPPQQTAHQITLPLHRLPPSPAERPGRYTFLPTGIRAIDGLVPLAYGQRVAVIANAGVGKSTLLGAVTRFGCFDAIVIGLIGERGREIPEFIDKQLTPWPQQPVFLFAATSDEPPLARWNTALAATSVAEYFRAQGKRVLLIIDSLTRCARAIREFSLRDGEVPVRHGFTPAVFELLPKLVERAGATHTGSITAWYSLLAEPGRSDPLAEEVISLLDGQIILSETLRSRRILPAIDPIRSLSRIGPDVQPHSMQHAGNLFKRLWGLYERDHDLLSLSDNPSPELLRAAKNMPRMEEYIRQNLVTPANDAEQLLTIIE